MGEMSTVDCGQSSDTLLLWPGCTIAIDFGLDEIDFIDSPGYIWLGLVLIAIVGTKSLVRLRHREPRVCATLRRGALVKIACLTI